MAAAGLMILPATAETDFMPLPSDALGRNTVPSNPAVDLTDEVVRRADAMPGAKIPESFTVDNTGGEIRYDSAEHSLSYLGGDSNVHLRTDDGVDVTAGSVKAQFNEHIATLTGPLVIYRGETLTRADRGVYNWETEELDFYNVRTKAQGLLVRGSRIEYRKDAQGKQFMRIHDAYVSTEDVKVPSSWIGAGELTVYPGDYGRVTRLSIAGEESDIAIPIIGWFSFSHSLNPKEGYLPHPGSKSAWGAYLLNTYGFLLGNRHVENGIPVSDYVLTLHADYRTRRGFATGVDLEDCGMLKKYKDMRGLSLYYLQDESPMINPARQKRLHTDHERYRIALQALWELPAERQDVHRTLTTNINAFSDRYVLRDFFEDEGALNDKPDNSVRLEQRTRRSQVMLLTRGALNDYYATDERAELSYYRTRTTIGNSGISYETRNSLGALRQYLPTLLRAEYSEKLDNLRDPDMQNYYRRLLNTSAFFRASTTHEFTTSFSILNFLNVTPKTGFGYTGYYDVDGIGSDNRFLGYLGCDFDIKFHRNFESFRIPQWGMKGLTHVVHPYTSLSHCSISSSNQLVPKLDTWSNVFGNSTSNPMTLDLIGFTGIDAWGTWTVWRIGAQNSLLTTVDGSPHTLLNWNVFIDYNEENPNTSNSFSNLYSLVTFRPTTRFSFTFESQTPTVRDGDGFSQYNTSAAYCPFAWLECRVGHRYINNHPIQHDSSQMYTAANLRINENYSVFCRWSWDIENKRLPIQQYSVFRRSGPWYVGATLFLRNNGGKKETGFGISFTLGETGTALPVDFF